MFNKTLIAAAVATLAISGTANAAISSSNGGELFVMAYDSTSANTFIATLDSIVPTANSFTGNSNLSQNFAADANWVAFTSNAKFNAATTNFQVLGIDTTSNHLWSSSNDLVAGNNSATGIQPSNYNQVTSSTGFIVGSWLNYYTGTGASSALVASGVNGWYGQMGNQWSNQMLSFHTDAVLGSNDSFLQITNVPAVTSGRTIVSPASTNTTKYSGVWNLASNGLLTYSVPVAAVPEADSWLMLVAGLGLMGFMARRRVGA